MYLLFITVSLCVTYFILYAVFPLFFTNRFIHLTKDSVRSVLKIMAGSLVGYYISFSVPDPELSNRVLHGFGGGCMAMFVCYLVVKDTRLPLRRFQFLLFSFLIVALLGIANELLEFMLQNYGGLVFAASINDTWYDLASNTLGSAIAGIFLVFLVNAKAKIDNKTSNGINK